MWKSKCENRTRSAALLEVEMMKKCTPLGAKHIWKSKCAKHSGFETLFWMLGCLESVRRCGAKHFWKSTCKNTPRSDHSKGSTAPRYTTLHHATPRYTTLHHSTPCYLATPRYTLLHLATPCYTMLHLATPCYSTLHHATPR